MGKPSSPPEPITLNLSHSELIELTSALQDMLEKDGYSSTAIDLLEKMNDAGQQFIIEKYSKQKHGLA